MIRKSWWITAAHWAEIFYKLSGRYLLELSHTLQASASFLHCLQRKIILMLKSLLLHLLSKLKYLTEVTMLTSLTVVRQKQRRDESGRGRIVVFKLFLLIFCCWVRLENIREGVALTDTVDTTTNMSVLNKIIKYNYSCSVQGLYLVWQVKNIRIVFLILVRRLASYLQSLTNDHHQSSVTSPVHR